MTVDPEPTQTAETPHAQAEVRLTIDEAMVLLDLGRAAVYRKVKDGALSGQKSDGRLTFARADVEALRDKLATERQTHEAELQTWFTTFAPVTDDAAQVPAPELTESAPAGPKMADVGQRLLETAFASHVEDIYVDPVVDGDRVIFHTGGQRDDRGRLSAELATELKGWIKSKSAVTLDPDGTGQAIGQIEIDGARHQYRLDVLPTLMGEHLHLRLFPQTAHLDELGGYLPVQLDALRRCLSAGAGLVLLTDATDAWSERHRRALSQEITQAGHLVVSLEHRLQYRSEMLVQLDLSAEGRPAFGELWRSALAMDPDALFVDELQDAEAARLAIDGASGCLVVAQMMAADADAAWRRLTKWEVDLAALDGVLLVAVERIHVRRLCSHCRKEANDASLSSVDRHFLPLGCEICGDGYAGMQAVCGLRIAGVEDPALGLTAALRHAVESGVTPDGHSRLRTT